jgi:hypothetical protein
MDNNEEKLDARRSWITMKRHWMREDHGYNKEKEDAERRWITMKRKRMREDHG